MWIRSLPAGIKALGMAEGGGGRETFVSYFRVLDALTQEEPAGYGSGQSGTAGTDSHPERVSERLGQEPFWFDREVYVNQGCYRETAGLTLVYLKTRTSGMGRQGRGRGGNRMTWAHGMI